MNIINVKIDFEHGICRNKGISVVTGDYNSTKVVFEFADEIDGTKIFEMKNPEGELVYADEIINNEVVLVGYKEENGETETYSLFAEEGDYIFEVSLYGNDSKLTSVSGYINATKEQVIVEGEEVQEKITLFDNLMQEVNTAISETNNLDLDVSKEGNISTVTVTKKDGTEKSVEIKDATINGMNSIELVAGENIIIEQRGNRIIISATGVVPPTPVGGGQLLTSDNRIFLTSDNANFIVKESD